MMGTNIVTHKMNRSDVLSHLLIQFFQKGNEFLLPFAFLALPIDPARTRIKSRQEVEGAGTGVLMLVPIGQIAGLGGPRGGWPRPWLQGGLLIDGQYPLILPQGARVEVNQLGNGRIEGGVPWLLGVKPKVMTPGFELMGGQNPSNRGAGDLLNEALSNALTCQFGTIPLGEATPQWIWAFTGEADHMARDLWGKNHPWPRGQGRQQAPRDVGRESASPTCVRRGVGHPPIGPPEIANAVRPTASSYAPGAPALPGWWWSAATAPASRVPQGTGR